MIKEKVLKDETRRWHDDDHTSPTYWLVSSVIIDTRSDIHDSVKVYNRGGLAGTLIVDKGDGIEIARRLLPDG